MPLNVDPGDPSDDVAVYSKSEVDGLLAALPPSSSSLTEDRVNQLIDAKLAGYLKSPVARSSLASDVQASLAKADTAVQPTTPPPPPPPDPPPTSGTLLFNGDFSTSNFSQWNAVHNKLINNSGPRYDSSFGPNYPYVASIVQDGGIPTARFEVRNGDPGIIGVGGSPRSEVADFNSGHMTEGSVTWQKFSVKLDASWPTTASGTLWSVISQWHSDTDGSPPLGLGCVTNGKMQLGAVRYAGPGSELSRPKIWETDMLPGTWHDLKFNICWSTSDTVGYVRIWRNGVLQTLADGSQKYFIRTMMPSGGNNYFKQGLYRGNRPETGIVFHRGYRFATSESALG